MNYNLYLITDKHALRGKHLLRSIEDSIKGGVTIVQLREKSMSSKDYINLAQQVKKITDRYHIPLIINDRVDIALAVDASGVHLGFDDMPINIARKLMGPDKIIGASACTLEEAIIFQKLGANYLGVGAVFATTTKKDADKVSITQLKEICETISIPIIAIGGINKENASSLQNTGITGIAVSSGILGKEDILEASQHLRIF